MKLEPMRSLPSMKLAGRMSGELHADLTAYAAYYREAVGESIALWPLAIEILRTFVGRDREFQAWRRQRRKRAGAAVD